MSTPHSVYTFPAVPAEGESDHERRPAGPLGKGPLPLIDRWPRALRQKLSGSDERPGGSGDGYRVSNNPGEPVRSAVFFTPAAAEAHIASMKAHLLLKALGEKACVS